MIFKVSQNDAEYFDNWKFKWKILPNKEKIENTFCKQEDKVLTLQVSIYLMITMNTNPQLIYTYFINTNSVIIIVIAEKRKHISTCDPHFIDDSPTLHTQCTPLANITSSSNQSHQHYTREFQIRRKHTINVHTINALSSRQIYCTSLGKKI